MDQSCFAPFYTFLWQMHWVLFIFKEKELDDDTLIWESYSMKIRDMIIAIENNRIRITDHADEEAQSDDLSFDEIVASVFTGEIIENYPQDKPFPSCLVLGQNNKDEPIHSVWAFNRDNNWAVLITVYRPDPDRWIEWRIRRKKDDSL